MIKIQLDNQQAAFIPGDTIEGSVSWENLRVNTEEIDIRLIWYTTGKGDRDCEIIANQLVTSPEIMGKTRFRFVAPKRPYSFSGKLVSLVWAVEVVNIPDLEAEQVEFVVSNSGTEIVLDGG